MEEVKNSVQQWLGAGRSGHFDNDPEVVRAILSHFEHGTLKFPEFVHTIITHVESEQDLTVVGRVLELMCQVFKSFPSEGTSRNDIHALVPYLCSRTENASPGVFYVAESLHFISRWTRFPPGDAQAVVSAVFKLGSSNNFSSQTAITRLALYQLIDSLFMSYPDALKRDLSIPEMIQGLVTMAELEKGPSCLRALFQLYAKISRSWVLGSEEYKLVFDSYIRYFPVSMRDAPPDPAIPTTAELRELLLQCFVSSDGYASMTFGAMIDRLDVDSANTKVEVFRTIQEAAKTYSIPTLSLSAPKLWDTLKFEIWNGENDDFIRSSLDVLHLLAASLDRQAWEWDQNDNPLYSFVISALTECKQRIRDKQKTFLRPCGRIIHAIASSSLYPFYLTTRFMLPVLDLIWQASDGEDKSMVLEALNNLVRARLAQTDVVPLPADDFAALPPVMREYRQLHESHVSNAFEELSHTFLEIYQSDVTQLTGDEGIADEVPFGVPAIQGLALMFRVPHTVSKAEKSTIVEQLLGICLDERQLEVTRTECVTALGQITTESAEFYLNTILPRVMDELPSKISLNPDIGEVEISSAISRLEILVQITSVPSRKTINYIQNFEAMQRAIIEKLNVTMEHNGQLQYQHALLAAITALFGSVETNSTSSAELLVPPQDSLAIAPILTLLDKIIQAKEYEGIYTVGYTGVARTGDGIDDKFVQLVGEYIMYALRYESTVFTGNFLTSWEKQHPNEPSAIWTLFSAALNPETLAKYQPDLLLAPSDKCLANVLSMYMIAGIRREDMKLLKPKFDIGYTASNMIQNATKTNPNYSQFIRQSILYFLQLLINKYGAAREISGADGNSVEYTMQSHVQKTKFESKEEGINTFRTLAYFAAAALAALDRSTEAAVFLMLDSINHPQYGRKVAQSFRILLSPSPILIKENFCRLHPLRYARLYELAVSKLISTWRNGPSPEVKQNALIALAGIVAFLDAEMLSEHALELFPVLLEGTNVLGDDFAKEACIAGILKVIPTHATLVEEHLRSVIDRMTDRTHNTYNSPSDSNARCRALALDVLYALTKHVNVALLRSRKTSLMSELDFALEDCSRDVRHKAEQCKMAWFNLSEIE